MVLEAFRERSAPYRARAARPFLRLAPSSLSAIALALAALGAVLSAVVRWTTPILFLAVAALVFLSGVFDVIDGEVARTTGRSSVRGDFLDHTLDRYADLLLILGLAASSFADPVLALLALSSLLLTSYMGTQAQAVGLGRLYGGLLTRADRLLLLAFAAFLEGDLSLPWPWAPSAPFERLSLLGLRFTVLDVLMLYFLVAGQLTAAYRALWVYRALPGAAPPAAPPRIL